MLSNVDEIERPWVMDCWMTRAEQTWKAVSVRTLVGDGVQVEGGEVLELFPEIVAFIDHGERETRAKAQRALKTPLKLRVT